MVDPWPGTDAFHNFLDWMREHIEFHQNPYDEEFKKEFLKNLAEELKPYLIKEGEK